MLSRERTIEIIKATLWGVDTADVARCAEIVADALAAANKPDDLQTALAALQGHSEAVETAMDYTCDDGHSCVDEVVAALANMCSASQPQEGGPQEIVCGNFRAINEVGGGSAIQFRLLGRVYWSAGERMRIVIDGKSIGELEHARLVVSRLEVAEQAAQAWTTSQKETP